jgi:hypothetical protein
MTEKLKLSLWPLQKNHPDPLDEAVEIFGVADGAGATASAARAKLIEGTNTKKIEMVINP